MIDTCNIRTVVGTGLRNVFLRTSKHFKGYGKMKISEDGTDASLDLKGHPWINNIRLKSSDGKDMSGTIIMIDFSYPRYYHSENVILVETEEKRQKVNKELLRIIRVITKDESVSLNNIRYLRIDVAQQFEDVFEDYYLIFALMYKTFVKSMGAENKKSKKYSQIDQIADKDYTIGFTYSKGEYKINIYNKKAQMDKKTYVPGQNTLIRVEQVFTPKVLRVKAMPVDKTTMKILKKEYSRFLEKNLLDYLNIVLETNCIELSNRLEETLNNGARPLPSKIKDMQNLILDFEMVENIIKNLWSAGKIPVKNRQMYNCIYAAKESLEETEKTGDKRIKFFGNFSRMTKILFHMTSIKTKIEDIQGVYKIDIKN